jgi:RNA polymerase sigma factor (sigma-70 family)
VHTTTQLAAEVVRSGAPAARVALTALYERVLERIYRYFRRSLRDPNDADECLQRTVVLLEESLRERTYDPGRSFNAWMWLKARTVYAQWCRERDRSAAGLVDEGAVADDAQPQAHAEAAHDAAVVLARLRDALRPEVYETFVLAYTSGLSQREAAAALDCTDRTVRNRLKEAHEALAKLRPELLA